MLWTIWCVFIPFHQQFSVQDILLCVVSTLSGNELSGVDDLCLTKKKRFMVDAANMKELIFLLFSGLGDDVTPDKQPFYMDIYAAISLLQISAALINQLDLKYLSKVAADSLHQAMLDRLLHAPMAFFHTTPSGRIINRLTRGTSDIDKNLADFVAFFLRWGTMCGRVVYESLASDVATEAASIGQLVLHTVAAISLCTFDRNLPCL